MEDVTSKDNAFAHPILERRGGGFLKILFFSDAFLAQT
jgi:hypothetical protein